VNGKSRLSGLVDFCHCGRRGTRDRACRTISPSSATQTTGASTDKISHHTSMRSSNLFRHHRGRSIESGRDAINTIAIATAYPIKRSIIAFTHSPTGTLHMRMGESCDWGHRNLSQIALGTRANYWCVNARASSFVSSLAARLRLVNGHILAQGGLRHVKAFFEKKQTSE
jgi:hypothetical protein